MVKWRVFFICVSGVVVVVAAAVGVLVVVVLVVVVVGVIVVVVGVVVCSLHTTLSTPTQKIFVADQTVPCLYTTLL